MPMTLVSTLLPTYDRVEFVGGAIETVLGQTHEAVEVIVVNDGSTDGTERVLEAYRARDERVRPFHRSANRGIADGRNHALAHARGEYVCVLDDDDRWHPEKIERQLAVFDDCDETCGVVYTGGVACRNGRAVGTYSPRADRRGDIYPEILADFGLNPYSSHMIRRSCFERVGTYDTRFPHGEDWDLSIRLAREYEFAAVPEPLVERRLHEANRSQQFRDTTDMELVWDEYGAAIRRHPEIEARFVTRWYRRRSRVALERGAYAEAIALSLRTATRQPSANALALVASACLGRRGLSVVRRLRAHADRYLATAGADAGLGADGSDGTNANNGPAGASETEGNASRSPPGRSERPT
jgi:glycosyltransferase involved in cell wall biosynthesis